MTPTEQRLRTSLMRTLVWPICVVAWHRSVLEVVIHCTFPVLYPSTIIFLREGRNIGVSLLRQPREGIAHLGRGRPSTLDGTLDGNGRDVRVRHHAHIADLKLRWVELHDDPNCCWQIMLLGCKNGVGFGVASRRIDHDWIPLCCPQLFSQRRK